jgi:DNA segregation ATPase FtsK/SpoIIIE-like protein
MLLTAILITIALFDFSPQQSHFITTNCSAEANNLTGTLGSSTAFWLFRFWGASAYLLPFIPFYFFLYCCSLRKILFLHIFSLTAMSFLLATLLAWVQRFYSINIFSTLTAGLGGIFGDLIVGHVALPLLGKLGTAITLCAILFFQITLHIHALFRKHPYLRKPFLWTWILSKFCVKTGYKCFGKKQPNGGGNSEQNVLEGKENPHGTENGNNFSTSTGKEKVMGGNVQIFEERRIDKTSTPLKKCDPNYVFPPIDLLECAKTSGNNQENCEVVIQRLIEVLAQFGIAVSPGEIHKGPVITRYEVTPEAGVRVEKIASLDKNIALGLAAKSVRIIAPVPGKSCVGIELPNKYPSRVHLRAILESKNWAEMQAAIPIVLGRGVTGEPMIYDLAKMPHLLIAGATGAGKTVCINAIIASLLYHASPADLRFIMVDPKIVEMQNYNKLPHMLIPVVTDPHRVPNALKWLIGEMESRYKIFAKAGARNIDNYNEKLSSLQKAPLETDFVYKKLPYIICIIDELADLMMIAPGDIETDIARLAQLARAAGIHLILATQRPSVNVITGIIKANLPSRIAFKVSSKVDSRTILDSGGAEALLGQGDMLFSPPGASGLLRAQGALVSDDEINGIVDFLYEKNGGPKIEQSVQEQIENNGESLSGKENNWEDELIPRALEIIRAHDHASTSFLQRKLKIGYNRAARIMDTLRSQGFVDLEGEN